MARVRFHGRISNVKLGLSASSTVDIAANVKYVRWRDRSDRVQAVTVAQAVLPVGWRQGHRQASMEIGVLSEAADAFYSQATAYIVDNADNVVIPYLQVSLTDHAAATKTFLCTSTIVDYVEYDVSDFEDSVNVYHLKMYWIAKPA